MAVTGAFVFHGGLFYPQRIRMSTTANFKSNPVIPQRLTVSSSINQVSSPDNTTIDASFEINHHQQTLTTVSGVSLENGSRQEERGSLKDFFDQSIGLIRSDGGPPRWFSPLECGSRLNNSPLLLFLPGIDGVGLGLIKHHQRLGKIFDVWCLHIPVRDRTPFTDLLKLVEKTVKAQHHHSPNRPIYLVGESLGACLALSVAARNPDIDLVLILSNPATCFSRSPLQPVISLLEFMPESLQVILLGW